MTPNLEGLRRTPPLTLATAAAALFALVMPIEAAAKVTSAVLLLLLPAGLAVMFHGMKKSPLLGLLGLPFVWNTLTHWGFINFMAALGLFAMVVGLSLMTVDAPTRGRQIALAVTLLLVFSTHIFRFPSPSPRSWGRGS